MSDGRGTPTGFLYTQYREIHDVINANFRYTPTYTVKHGVALRL